MPGEFVPFLASVRSKVGSAVSTARSDFSPVAAGAPAAGALAASPVSNPATPPAHGEVNIELKRSGDRITQIRVQCRCGEVIELDCEY